MIGQKVFLETSCLVSFLIALTIYEATNRDQTAIFYTYFYVLVCVLDFFVCVLDFLFTYWSLAWAVNGTCQPCTRLRLRFVYFNILGVIYQGSWCFLHCFFLFRVWCCLGVRHCHPSSREKTQRAKKWKRQSWSWNGASKTGKFTTVGLFNWENACSSKILRTAITLEFFFKNESAPKCEFPSLIFSAKVPLFKEILERRSFFSKLDVQCSIFNRVV